MATEVVKFSPFWTQGRPGGSLILDRNLAAMAKALENANATFIRVDASVTNIIDGTTPIALPATRIAFGDASDHLSSTDTFWRDPSTGTIISGITTNPMGSVAGLHVARDIDEDHEVIVSNPNGGTFASASFVAFAGANDVFAATASLYLGTAGPGTTVYPGVLSGHNTGYVWHVPSTGSPLVIFNQSNNAGGDIVFATQAGGTERARITNVGQFRIADLVAGGYVRAGVGTGRLAVVATIPASDITGLFYQTIQNAGVDVTQQPIWNASTGLTAVNNGGATRTDVTVNLSTGIAGGQSAIGGTAASENLTLSSTTNGTKGKIILGSTTGMQFNETTNVSSVGIAVPAVDTFAHYKYTGATGANLYIQNPSAATTAYTGITIGSSDAIFGSPAFGFWWYGPGYTTSGNRTAGSAEFELLLGSGNMLFNIGQAAGDFIWSTGAGGLVERMRLNTAGLLTLTSSDASTYTVLLTKAGDQTIEKRGSGTFFIGTAGAQDTSFYTNNVARMAILGAGDTRFQNSPSFTYSSGALITPTAPTIAQFNIQPASLAAAATMTAPWTWDAITQTMTGTTAVTNGYRFFKIAAPTITDASGVSVSWISTLEVGTPVIGGAVSNGNSHVAIDMLIGADDGGWSITKVGGTNYERLVARHITTPNDSYYIRSEAGGAGTTKGIAIDAGSASTYLTTTLGAASIFAGSSGVSVIATAAAEQIVYTSQFTRTSAAGMVADMHKFNSNLTISSNVNITTATGVNAVVIGRPAYDGSGVAKTITHAASVYIANSPNPTNSLTITNAYALWIDAGLLRYDGAIALGGGAAATLGTIGGGGPGTAAQNKWLSLNVDGTIYYLPLWI